MHKYNPLLNNNFVLLLILLNAIVIFLQCIKDTPMLSRLDTVFMLAFIFEMFSKWYHYGWKGYWSMGWNRFDGVITLLSSVSLIQFMFPAIGFMSFEWLIAIRAMRAMRALRFFRLLRILPDNKMQTIIVGTKRAIESSYVIIFAFMIMSFVVSIVSCNLFRTMSPEYFGDPLTSFYTIFRLFTIEGWYDIPDAIAQQCTSPYWGAFFIKIYFTVLLFLGGIIGMSFINSIIVDAMVSDNNDEVLEQISNLESKITRLEDQLSKTCELLQQATERTQK